MIRRRTPHEPPTGNNGVAALVRRAADSLSSIADAILAGATGITALFTLAIYLPGVHIPALEFFCGNQTFRLMLLAIAGLVTLHYISSHRRWGAALAGILSLILLLEVVTMIPLFPPAKGSLADGKRLRVITYNSKYTKWRLALGMIYRQHADIACLQEVGDLHEERPRILRQAEKAGYKVVYIDFGSTMLVLCRGDLEIIDTVKFNGIAEGTRRMQVILKATVDGESFHLLPVHLQGVDIEGKMGGATNAWQARYSQAREINDAANRLGPRVLVAGDFNSTPTDRVTRLMRRGFKDAWLEAGVGPGFTWYNPLPFFRIDYILFKGFKGAMQGKLIDGASDHYALQVDLKF